MKIIKFNPFFFLLLLLIIRTIKLKCLNYVLNRGTRYLGQSPLVNTPLTASTVAVAIFIIRLLRII